MALLCMLLCVCACACVVRVMSGLAAVGRALSCRSLASGGACRAGGGGNGRTARSELTLPTGGWGAGRLALTVRREPLTVAIGGGPQQYTVIK